MHISLFTALCLTLWGSIVTSQPLKRAGPSGQVVSPASDSWFSTLYAYNTAVVNFQYTPVNQNKGDCEAFDCYIKTSHVEVALRDSDGKETTLATYLAPPFNHDDIQAYLVLPTNGVEGKYQLVVYETQFYYGKVIRFQAAAPYININDEPLP